MNNNLFNPHDHDDHRRQQRKEQIKRIATAVILGALVVYALLFVQLGFYIHKPGTAESVEAMVQSERPDVIEEGTFMLTTVRVLHTNIINYIYALFAPHHELIQKKTVLRNGETEAEYAQRQIYVMNDSQSNAIQAAYNKAGIKYEIADSGALVLQVIKDMPAHGIMRAGDRIVEIDQLPISNHQDINNIILSKKPGDVVNIVFVRKDEQKSANITLSSMKTTTSTDGSSSAEEIERPAMGVNIANLRSIVTEDEEMAVKIKADDIGGPSAGLMFTLEIYSRLIGEDLTRGYKVAGTGTIDPNGTVGVIGGIKHKIVAADREGADIFLAPADWIPEPGGQYLPILNYSDAVEQAKKIKSNMQVVSVETLDQAVQYLRTLPPKDQ